MSNYYVLYGTDKSIIDNELAKIKAKITTTDVVKYSMNDTDINTILEDASTISMFSSKKILILEDAIFLVANKSIENLNLLEEYIKNSNNINSYLIFIVNSEKIDTRKKVYKLLATKAKIIECNKKNSANYVKNYVTNYLQIHNYTLENTDYFLNKVGSNLHNIQNELDKLFMFDLNRKVITNEDIDLLVVKNMENEIFDLTDAIINKDVKKSLDLLEQFTSRNYEEIQIIILLANQFRFLFQVKRLLNKNKDHNTIANILGVNPYRVKFTIKKLYYYSEEMLLDNIKKLAQMDKKIKLGLIDKKIALQVFIVK